MNNKVGLGAILLILLLLTSPLFAEDFSLGVSTLTISGKVEPKSIFDVNQILGEHPGIGNALPLDSGDILLEADSIGVKVGDWSVTSNSNAILKLIVNYDEFVFNDTHIPYIVNNGTENVAKGGLFAILVRNGGIYSPEDNSGDIFIKRIDSNSYPPSYEYETTIQFTISTE